MVKVKILIIDDEEDFCLLLKEYFLRRNYEVHLAYNLTDGIYLLKEVSPAILFLDNNLPDGEGWKMAEELNEKYPKMNINLMSSYKQNNTFDIIDKIRIWEKPITAEELEKIFI